jgi:hypothetical protein
MAWWTVWPLEVAKSQIQSGLPGPTKVDSFDSNAPLTSLLQIIPRLGYILKTQGMRAMSRGLFIGSMRSVVANGARYALIDEHVCMRDQHFFQYVCVCIVSDCSKKLWIMTKMTKMTFTKQFHL